MSTNELIPSSYRATVAPLKVGQRWYCSSDGQDWAAHLNRMAESTEHEDSFYPEFQGDDTLLPRYGRAFIENFCYEIMGFENENGDVYVLTDFGRILQVDFMANVTSGNYELKEGI